MMAQLKDKTVEMLKIKWKNNETVRQNIVSGLIFFSGIKNTTVRRLPT